MRDIFVSQVEPDEVEWLEREFNSQWPWPRGQGFVGHLIEVWPHFVARDASERYLGHCHVRLAAHPPIAEDHIPEIADLNVMPNARRRGAASALMDAAEHHASSTSREVCVGVGLYNDYGPAQRLYTRRGYVLDGTGAWHGA